MEEIIRYGFKTEKQLRKIDDNDFFLMKELYYNIIIAFFNEGLSSKFYQNSSGYTYGFGSNSLFSENIYEEEGLFVQLNYRKKNQKLRKYDKDGKLITDAKADLELVDIVYEDGLVMFERYFKKTNVLVSSVRFEKNNLEIFCKIDVSAEKWDKLIANKLLLGVQRCEPKLDAPGIMLNT